MFSFVMFHSAENASNPLFDCSSPFIPLGIRKSLVDYINFVLHFISPLLHVQRGDSFVYVSNNNINSGKVVTNSECIVGNNQIIFQRNDNASEGVAVKKG